MTTALEIEITAPVASFRNSLYAGVQAGLPCPPTATIGGLLAAAAGGWAAVPVHTRFAACFVAHGRGVDLETYHPLAAQGSNPPPTPKNRDFLANVRLTLWLFDDLDLWRRAVRRPVWPLRLGRSQDLASARARQVALRPGDGLQGRAIIPASVGGSGALLRLPTAVSLNRERTVWDSYRYAAGHSKTMIAGAHVTTDGQAVVLLPPPHPARHWPETS